MNLLRGQMENLILRIRLTLLGALGVPVLVLDYARLVAQEIVPEVGLAEDERQFR
jgi:hypothetical protein